MRYQTGVPYLKKFWKQSISRWIITLFLAGVILFTTGSPFVRTSVARASDWAGWDAIDTIYYNPSQEDPNNTFLATAATELETYLEQMSGRSWTIVNSDPAGPAIRLQVNQDAPEFSGRGDEASRTIVDDNGIMIIGKTPIAVREGSYLFLDSLGVRWLMAYEPYWTVVPDSLPGLSARDEINEPAYIFRRLWGGEPTSRASLRVWRKRNLLGGAATYEVSHTYYNIMPQELYATYPDAYLPEGQTPPSDSYDNWQLKPDNPDVISRAIDYGLERASAETSYYSDTDDNLPDKVVSISPNDGVGWGSYFSDNDWTHEKTIALTNLVEGLTNTVAEALAGAGSDKYAGVYNYSWYSDTPTIDFNSNVFVEVATAYAHTGVSASTRIAALHEHGALVGIREYYDPWSWIGDGVPDWAMRDLNNIKTWNDLGCTVYNAEGGDSWGSAGLVYYISARLQWNPELSIDGIIDDFCTSAFGPATGTMKKFYELWLQGTQLTKNSYAVAFRLLDQALDEANGDEDIINRIDYELYWMYYIWKYNSRTTLPESELENFYTFTTKLSKMFVVHYHYAEKYVRNALISRFPEDWPSTTAVQSLLTDNTVPTPEEARGWLDEALDAFSNELGVTAFYINPAELDLVALGDTNHPVFSPINTRSGASVIFTALANETVQLSLKGFSPGSSTEFSVYDDDGNFIDKIPTTGNDWTAINFTVPETGMYKITGGGSITVLDHPFGQTAGQFRGNDLYLYVPEGTTGFFIEFENGCYNSYLYDPDNELAGTYTGGLDTIGVNNPSPGLWHLAYGGMNTTQTFEVYGIPDIVCNDPELILVPAAGYIPTEGNHAPNLNTIGSKSVIEGKTLEFTVSAVDPDGNPLTYSASNLPAGASFNTSSGVFSWTPVTGQTGTYKNVRFSASDGSLTDREYVTIKVNPVLVGDISEDGAVNILDVILITYYWGQSGASGWIPEDLNSDGKIDVLDLAFLAAHWTG
jgi:hypothetical protein